MNDCLVAYIENNVFSDYDNKTVIDNFQTSPE